MLKRKRLTPAEHDEAVAAQLRFYADGDETEDECLKRTQKAIKNSRSTNPMKQKDKPPPKRSKPKSDRPRSEKKSGPRDPS